MALIGAHMLLYTAEPDSVRALLRDAFGFKWVDAHNGWLIFALPPSELGVHPGDGPAYRSGVRHEVAFMCDNLRETMVTLGAKGVLFEGQPEEQRYGITITARLARDLVVTLYEPHHKLAIDLR